MTYSREISNSKKAMRKKAGLIISELTQDSGTAALGICDTPQYKAASMIFTYVGVGRECATLPLISRALADGKAVCVPLCEKGGVMTARLITDTKALHHVHMGLLEPGACAPLVMPHNIDLAIVPCLMATMAGERLGHGGGYYDRYLSDCRAYKILLCRRELLVPALPCDAHDIRCDEVILANQ